MKKETKTLGKAKTTSPDTFTASQVGMLIERLEGQFKLFSEGLTGLNQRMDMFFVELGRQKENITIINLKITSINNEITGIKGEITDINLRLTNIEKTNKEIIKIHDERISRLEALK